jgi:hypothetical protein
MSLREVIYKGIVSQLGRIVKRMGRLATKV